MFTVKSVIGYDVLPGALLLYDVLSTIYSLSIVREVFDEPGHCGKVSSSRLQISNKSFGIDLMRSNDL